MTARVAAQYIRMSTDKQDLSPAVQKEAIAAYASARGIEIAASYEDEGRSGLHLKNRPGLQRLLRDVTEAKNFTAVLVYDVSRWGRFQDADAAAYYEYHCRLHGVDVIYVAEMFGAEVSPITALLKSMKRAMAAEYSRDLAQKCRAGQDLVIQRGFQMGPLPPLGFRRCSVSADGQHRVVLAPRQRKPALTDRIEWVLAPQEEVDLVKRICHMYAHMRLTLVEIAEVGAAEGWRNHAGKGISRNGITSLVKNEALIGNFVWGRRTYAKCMEARPPSRSSGRVPRIVDDVTWAQMQQRIRLNFQPRHTVSQLVERVRMALQNNSMLAVRDFKGQDLPAKKTIRSRIGSWDECVKLAGFDPVAVRSAIEERMKQRQADSRAFEVAITSRLREEGFLVRLDRRLHTLFFDACTVRLRLLWPANDDGGLFWSMQRRRLRRDVDFELLARMDDRFKPRDFFLATPAEVASRFGDRLESKLPRELGAFCYESPPKLLEKFALLSRRVTHATMASARKTLT